MNIAILFPFLAIVAGAMTAFQPLINAKLSNHLDSSIWASLVSFSGGTIILLILTFFMSHGKMTSIDTNGLKWWMFSGGLIGAFYVTTALFVVPHLGVAVLVSLTTAGGLITAAILSHYGVLADIARPITLQKFFGMSLLALGALITLKA